MKFRFVFMAAILTALLSAGGAAARAELRPTPGFSGPLGLITVPTARMDPAGTARLTTALTPTGLHGQLGFQIAAPLYVGLRQTARTSDLWGEADRLYPGLDLRLRLMRETAMRPAMVVGLQSAAGHKRMAGEYIAFSKRYENIDLTGGIGWGRYGSAGHMKNPLAHISGHFDGPRPDDGESPGGSHDWFTGNVSFFGGVEYFPPWLDGVSVKAEWSADRYTAERQRPGFDTPAPWSVGVGYTPVPWLDLGAALSGDQISALVSLSAPLSSWPLRGTTARQPAAILPRRAGRAIAGDMMRAGRAEGLLMHTTGAQDPASWTMLETDGTQPLPHMTGRAARHMANHGGRETETMTVIPTRYGLRGPAIRFMRSDMERALAHGQGSPQEVWRRTDIQPGTDIRPILRRDPADLMPGRFGLILDTHLSGAEKDSGVLYRTSIVGTHRQPLSRRWLTGTDLRLNIHDNLERLNRYRPPVLLPVRGDVDRFAGRRVGLDRMFLAYTRTIGADFHAVAATGFLEEMYSGFGGEILYRPFGRTWAVGAEAWQTFKRDPGSLLNLALNGDHVLSAHINAWYEIPETDLTVQARFGRYLAEDIGMTLALENRFASGARLRAEGTASNHADFDVYGGRTHLYGGLRLSLPLGSLRYVPNGSQARLTAAPLGRNIGQSIDSPLPLYEMTDPFSLRRIARDWTTLLD